MVFYRSKTLFSATRHWSQCLAKKHHKKGEWTQWLWMCVYNNKLLTPIYCVHSNWKISVIYRFTTAPMYRVRSTHTYTTHHRIQITSRQRFFIVENAFFAVISVRGVAACLLTHQPLDAKHTMAALWSLFCCCEKKRIIKYDRNDEVYSKRNRMEASNHRDDDSVHHMTMEESKQNAWRNSEIELRRTEWRKLGDLYAPNLLNQSIVIFQF